MYAVHEWTKLTGPHLYHSGDGGATWSLLWQGSGGTALHGASQAGARTLFFAVGNEGLLRSTDLGQTWQSVGTFLPQFPAVATSPNFAADHTAFTVTLPDNWAMNGQDADGFGISRTANGGAAWSEPEASNPVNSGGFGTIFTTPAHGGVSMAVSPNFAADNVVYWGGGPGGFGVFKSVDGGQSWGQVTPLDRINEISADIVHGLAISAEPSGTLDTAIAMGRLFLMQDDPARTTRVEWAETGFPSAWAVAMSPSYQRDCTIYAPMWGGPSGIANTLDDGVYVSTNACVVNTNAGAMTGSRLTGSLPVRDFDTIALSPNFPADHTLFIGSFSGGVYRSTDSGQTWTPFSNGLGNQTVHQLTIAATGPQAGTLFAATDGGVWQTPVALVPPPPVAGAYRPLSPARTLDTRNTQQTLGPGSVLTIPISGLGGVPASGASAVVLTVFPAGILPRPTASNLNFIAGETVPNRVIVPVGQNGQVSLFNAQGNVDVVIDVDGWFTDGTSVGSGSALTDLNPARIYDSRNGPGAVGPGEARPVTVTGVGNVPSDATAVILNVTVTDTTSASYLTAYPAGVTPPIASDLNWVAGETVPNLVVVKVGAGGKIDLYDAAGRTDVVVDVFGYFG